MNFTNRDVTKNIIEFIKNNDLEFTAGRRNSDLVTLCGFTDYLCDYVSGHGISDSYDLVEEIESNEELNMIFSDWIDVHGGETAYDDIDTIWVYTRQASYGKWWTLKENRDNFTIHSPYLFAEKEKV
jgi:hypothetical protein